MPPRKTTSSIPKKNKSPPKWTSNASRKRRQPSCSLTSLKNLEDEDTLESEFIGYFGKTSESHATWGKTAPPIVAPKKRGGALRLKKQSLYTEGGIAALFGISLRSADDEPNSPNRSMLLRCSSEVRENIYSNILHYPKGIIIK